MHITLSIIAAVVFGGGGDTSGPSRPEIVVWDWYFRESLVAIADWEEILAREARAGGRAPEAPRVPVPRNGAVVRWPRPIPSRLLPPDDRSRIVRLRSKSGEVEVVRVAPERAASRQVVTFGDRVVGSRHPGGGGKDHWYHEYHRRFDGLLEFEPRPSSVSLQLEGPLDFSLGENELSLRVENISGEPRDLVLSLDLCTPAGSAPCGPRRVPLARGGAAAVRFPFVLGASGGGLLILAIEDGSDRFWIPLLTHVEDVRGVLRSIAQVLSDIGDAAGASHLDYLRSRCSNLERSAVAGEDGLGARWRELFEEACALRDELLLARVPFDAILFVKRKPFDSEQPFMDAHHLRNPPGGGIYRLSPVRPWGNVETVIDRLGDGIYRDVCLHWDARRFVFSFGNGSDHWDGGQSYHIYETSVDGSGLLQLTRGPKNDCEPFYIPGGRIGFTSDRSEHFVMCGGDRHVSNLFVMEEDGSGVRQLSFNVFNEFQPSMLPDGRILYSRWEYNERSVTSLHNPFTMHPDGTMVAPFYGNATIRPNVVMFPRPVPGSRKIMALFTAHHGQTHGAIGVIDGDRGRDGSDPVALLTRGIPVTGEKAEDSRRGWASDPVPITETVYLCSYTPTVVPWLETTWALYVGDRHGNLALVYRDPEISVMEPVPLVRRPRPPNLPPPSGDTHATSREATLVVVDVHEGLPGVRRGEARRIRILEDVPRKGVLEGGVICTSGTPVYTVKRILGTVPVEEDGSAHFVVPANRNVYFEVLDRRGREIQRMRSVVCLKPGEVRSCIGCHERPSAAPPARVPAAARRPPDRPTPPPWGDRALSFLRDVQPVLNDRCARCHTHDRAANRVILTDDLTDQFTVAYEELVGYLSVANAMRWDHPDDVFPRPPYTYGSAASRLVEILDGGHHQVELTDEEWDRLLNWIDANAVYYDTYEVDPRRNRRIFAGKPRENLQEVHARRCAPCHGGGDGRHGTWWLSLSWRDVGASRALLAPLARPAGGWGRCVPPPYDSTDDPDFRRTLEALRAVRKALDARPRADLASVRGHPFERKGIDHPPPPVSRDPVDALPDATWVYASDLAWIRGRAGWSVSGDGVPRRDRDIEGNLLRLGARRYQKGIGTHAPSTIVYALDGRYERFTAEVGGAERGGTVEFVVKGDGQVLFQSAVLQGKRDLGAVDLSVEGVRRLELIVTDAGDGYHADMANWAGARLKKSSKEAAGAKGDQ